MNRTPQEVKNRLETNGLVEKTDSSLRHLHAFFDKYPHSDLADLGGAGYEKNLIPLIGDDFDVYDPFYDPTFDICKNPLPRKYQTIVVMNTLEHVYDPVRAGENIAKSLKPGGYIFTTTPFMYHQHDYPSVPDYYRYTDTAMRYMFRDLEYVEHYYEQDVTDSMFSPHKSPPRPDNRLTFIAKAHD